MEVLTRHLQEDVPWCMLFADDILLVDNTREGVEGKLELWRSTLESKGFRLSRSKTEYMQCNFSSNRPSEGIATLGDQVINKSTRLRYLGSIVQSDGEIDGDIINRIQVGWLKWRNASGLLCDRNVPLKLKEKFYKIVVRPAMLYGAECWPLKEKHNTKLSVAEMRMLRWMSGFTLRDRIRNEHIREKVGVAPVEDKIRESRLRWFCHIKRRPSDDPVRRVEVLDLTHVKKVNVSSVSANLNNISVLSGSNFKKWKEHITIVLGCMDLDYAIWTEHPPALTAENTIEQMANFEKWKRSNRMSLMIMKHSIPDNIRGAMHEEENAKKFLSQIADHFVGSEKVETSTILSKLVSIRYKGKGNIKEYIMKMSNLITRLRALKLELSDDILVHLVLISLPAQFSPFKISYNAQKEKWTLNELIAQCVQEEEILKQEKVESAHLASSSHNFATKRKRNYKIKGAADKGTSQPKVQQKQD
ncbi:hypothetical protein KFK09_006690 [Dendrobium nobile]|uniref:Reverse transcriptase domain-containing protein n=1 Tax=Dendrobium nobile TaxID=94219 RepID=A0A8T3BQ86_DENNO|nr:hypothetical protein KFK09_006690 [Dendrobium nobile]